MGVPFLPLRTRSPANETNMGYEQEMKSYDEPEVSSDSLEDLQPLLTGGDTELKPGGRGEERDARSRRTAGSILAAGVAAFVVSSMVVALLTFHFHRGQPLSQQTSSINTEPYLKTSLPLLPLSLFAPSPRPLPSASDPFSQPNSWHGHAWLSQHRFSKPSLPPNITWPPLEYLRASYEFSAGARPTDDPAKGVKFNSTTGRPFPIPRSSLNLTHDNWEPPNVRVSDLKDVVRFPKVQWKGFKKARETDSENEKKARERQLWVKRAFLHAWEGYKKNAWGHDEVSPVSSGFVDPYNSWGATIVDSLDTLLIMNLSTEYSYAREHVRAVDFTFQFRDSCFSMELPASLHPLANGTKSRWECILPTSFSVFETTIRYLGGLLSAYELAQDPLMLDRALELGNWLLPALATSDGLPIGYYSIGHNPIGQLTYGIGLADAGSLTMEFTRLSMLSGDETFFQAAQRTIDTLDTKFATEAETNGTRLGTLLPTSLNSQYPANLAGNYVMGGSADSYYEYLLKMYQLTGGKLPQYKRMYEDAIESAKIHLMRYVEIPGWNNITIIGAMNGRSKIWKPTLEHLTCFAGGMLGLGSRVLNREDDFKLALNVTNSCSWLYETFKTGLGPESVRLYSSNDPNAYEVVSVYTNGTQQIGIAPTGIPAMVQGGDSRSMGRPETIESVFYMYRLTGDRSWQDRGWKMFTSWVEATIGESGFSALVDVDVFNPIKADSMQSFVLAETFKYYYLLFSTECSFSLDDWVFNTEAHPFRLPKPGHQPKFTSLWDGVEHASTGHEKIGEGTYVQQWARIQHAASG